MLRAIAICSCRQISFFIPVSKYHLLMETPPTLPDRPFRPPPFGGDDSQPPPARPIRDLPRRNLNWDQIRAAAMIGARMAVSDVPSQELLFKVGKLYQDQVLEHNATRQHFENEQIRRLSAEQQLWNSSIRSWQCAAAYEQCHKALERKSEQVFTYSQRCIALQHQLQACRHLHDEVRDLRIKLAKAGTPQALEFHLAKFCS